MKASSLRGWVFVHKWTSLICTVFLLLLCLTGLPLIFHHEINELTETSVQPEPVADGAQLASLDASVAAALAVQPGYQTQFISWDDEHPGILHISINENATADPAKNRIVRVDAYRTKVLDEASHGSVVMEVIYRLHVDMFMGLPGKLFLGAMGLLFAASLVSGVVVYKPSMSKQSFGDIRWKRVSLIKWLDLHNLLGIVVVMWMLVVGVTGSIATLGELMLAYWQNDQLADMVGPHKDRPRPDKLGSVQKAVDLAVAATPDMKPSFVAYPGTVVSSPSHYAVFFKGVTPLTSRLLKPVIIDAVEPTITDSRDLPWYFTAFLVSIPLHFGDYGGMPLKIIWALLDIVSIVVLISGLYLWLGRRGRRTEQRLSSNDRRDANPLADAAE